MPNYCFMAVIQFLMSFLPSRTVFTHQSIRNRKTIEFSFLGERDGFRPLRILTYRSHPNHLPPIHRPHFQWFSQHQG